MRPTVASPSCSLFLPHLKLGFAATSPPTFLSPLSSLLPPSSYLPSALLCSLYHRLLLLLCFLSLSVFCLGRLRRATPIPVIRSIPVPPTPELQFGTRYTRSSRALSLLTVPRLVLLHQLLAGLAHLV
ncbi:hypothetical protein NW759_001898 [Fusarium solani]|nr:hypothetical protein NW759_001898 [Fusarium solani]